MGVCVFWSFGLFLPSASAPSSLFSSTLRSCFQPHMSDPAAERHTLQIKGQQAKDGEVAKSTTQKRGWNIRDNFVPEEQQRRQPKEPQQPPPPPPSPPPLPRGLKKKGNQSERIWRTVNKLRPRSSVTSGCFEMKATAGPVITSNKPLCRDRACTDGSITPGKTVAEH